MKGHYVRATDAARFSTEKPKIVGTGEGLVPGDDVYVHDWKSKAMLIACIPNATLANFLPVRCSAAPLDPDCINDGGVYSCFTS